jgi:hypothetical protein
MIDLDQAEKLAQVFDRTAQKMDEGTVAHGFQRHAGATIRALIALVSSLEGEQARADAQAATIKALRARVKAADELARAARKFRLYSAELGGALAAYRATDTAEATEY